MFFKKFFKIIICITVILSSSSLLTMCCRKKPVIPAAPTILVATDTIDTAEQQAVKVAEVMHASRAAALHVQPSGRVSDVSGASAASAPPVLVRLRRYPVT